MMHWTMWLSALPFAGFLIGTPFLNATRPLVAGMPLLLAWLVFCVLMSSAVMGVVYMFDPVRRLGADQ